MLENITKTKRGIHMDKKFILILAGFLLIESVAAASFEQNVTVNVLPEKIAYIVRDTGKPDKAFLNAFNDLGLEIVLIDDDKIRQTNFSEYRAIFVGDEYLKNIKSLPKDSLPVIIANKYYGKDFGFLARGVISQMSSNSILRVDEESEIVKVYNRNVFKLGGPNLFYYYIPTKSQKAGLQILATTENGHPKLGSVVAYSNSTSNKCFFGIIKSQYWTEDARELFEDCVSYALRIN